MLISILALVLAALTGFYFNPIPTPETALLIVIGGTTILFIASLCYVLSLTPLQNLEQKLVPNLMELFRRDFLLRISYFWLFLFPFLSYLLAVIYGSDFPFRQWALPIWIVAFGISLDALKHSLHSLLRYLNPFYLVNLFTHDAKKAIQNEKDEDVWGAMDSLSEIALRAIEESKIALSNQALQAFPPVIRAFFASSKSISRVNLDKATEKETGLDEASYTIFYLLQRLELINDRALQKRLETVCRQMVMTMGKIIVYSAKYDLSMVSFPTHFLSKFGLKAQQHHFSEVTVLTTSTLLEIARTILTEVDITYAELQDPFQAIINGLDAIAKANFKKDKNTNIKVLIQPFLDLKALFQTEKMANHPDTPVIIGQIDRVLEEFATLEQVMRSIPTIPDLIESPPTNSPESSEDTISPA